jgi:hypothetical protein
MNDQWDGGYNDDWRTVLFGVHEHRCQMFWLGMLAIGMIVWIVVKISMLEDERSRGVKYNP